MKKIAMEMSWKNAVELCVGDLTTPFEVIVWVVSVIFSCNTAAPMTAATFQHSGLQIGGICGT